MNLHVVYNQSKVTTVILDNSITAMTGHQDNPASGKNAKGQPAPVLDLVAMVKACGIEHLAVVDPYDLPATEKAVREALAFDGPAVVITKRPCIL
ncbi:MAG: thiamine pyrophosphate-dependent enzyme, partial [Clostridiales bacterium]